MTIDFATRTVAHAGRELKLSRTEFAILECLAKSAGRVVTRDRLFDAVWGDRDVGDNILPRTTVRVVVKRYSVSRYRSRRAAGVTLR